jgi:TPR repeat protein
MSKRANRRLTPGPKAGIAALVLICAQSFLGAHADDRQPAPARAALAPVDSAEAAYRQGHDSYEKKNYAEAMRWYRVAAAQGNALAQVEIGNLYGMALGVPQDYAEALRWYRLAAARGNAEAQDQIGFFYLSGWGVPQDSAQAMNWFRKAADQGNEVAQRNIGVMFLQGMGVAPDRAEAIRWFRLAAGKGDSDAKEALKYLGAN